MQQLYNYRPSRMSKAYTAQYAVKEHEGANVKQYKRETLQPDVCTK